MVQYLKISWSYVRQYWHQLFITTVMYHFRQSTGSIAERIGSFCSHAWLFTAVDGSSGWRSSPLHSKNNNYRSRHAFLPNINTALSVLHTNRPSTAWMEKTQPCVWMGWRGECKTITTDPHSRCKVNCAHRLGKIPTWQVDKPLCF